MFRIEFSDNFGNVWDEIKQFTQVNESKLARIAEAVRAGIEGNLTRGTDFLGVPVKPLSPTTMKRKGHARPFFETGQLFESIKSKKTNEGEYDVFVSSNRSEIAYYLHFGTTRMPSRAFFGINADADREIDKILTEE